MHALASRISAASQFLYKVRCSLLLLLFVPLFGHSSDSLYLDSTYTALEEATTDSARAQIYLFMYLHISDNDQKLALEFAKKSLVLSEKAQFLDGIYLSHTNLGLTYRISGQTDSSITHHEQALIAARKLNDSVLVATCYVNYGILYKMLGDYEHALDLQLKALTAFKSVTDQDVRKKMAMNYVNIGNIYRRLGEYDRALEYHHKSLEIHRAIDKKTGIATNLLCIGNVYFFKKDYAQGIPYLEESIAISKEVDNLRGLFYGYNSLGAVHMNMKNYEKAAAKYLESSKILRKIGAGSAMQVNMFVNLAGLKIELEEYEVAKTYLDSAKTIAFTLRSKPSILLVYEGYTTLYKRQDDYKNALASYKMVTQYNDSLFSEKKSKEIGKLEAKHEFESEEAERKRTMEEKAKFAATAKSRRDNLQYSGILIFIVLLFGGVFFLGWFSIPIRLAEGMVFFSFLLFFEFTLVLLDPYIEQYSSGAPAIKLAFNAVLAGMIFPLHAFFEHKLKGRISK